MSEADRFRTELASAAGGLSDEIAVRWPVGAYKTTDDGRVTVNGAVGPKSCATKSCATSSLLDIGGSCRTRGDGTVVFALSKFQCLNAEGLGFEDPVNVVATSRATQPVHLSVRAEISRGTAGQSDGSITVSAGDLSGAPAADVPFYWRCLAPYDSSVT